jgi:sulfur-carrier protein
MTTVKLPGALRQYSDGVATTDVPAGSLSAVLDAVDARFPRLLGRVRDEQGELRRFVNVYVDGVDARASGGLTTQVSDRAEVLILPSVAGGSS